MQIPLHRLTNASGASENTDAIDTKKGQPGKVN